MAWIEVRVVEPNRGGAGRLLFLYDVERKLISVKHNGMGQAVLVDLLALEGPAAAPVVRTVEFVADETQGKAI